LLSATVLLRPHEGQVVTIVFPRVSIPKVGAERSQRNPGLLNDDPGHEPSDGRTHCDRNRNRGTKLVPFHLTAILEPVCCPRARLTIADFLILSAGFVLVVHYDRQRSWHLNEIEKSTRPINRKITIKTPDELLEGLTDEGSYK
jgi:hypothetical protein